VQDDAKRTMVGVRLERMAVRDLDDSEESQQDEAENRRRTSTFGWAKRD